MLPIGLARYMYTWLTSSMEPAGFILVVNLVVHFGFVCMVQQNRGDANNPIGHESEGKVAHFGGEWTKAKYGTGACEISRSTPCAVLYSGYGTKFSALRFE
eukprot:SAG11_NODE_1123_length_5778_cov_4.474027_4_plen_101_part_00